MKVLKKTVALLIAAVMLFSFAGCHKQGEIAVTVGDVEFTSAYYMCVLIFADSTAKATVIENLGEDADTDDVNYYAQKIDGVKYVDWVKDTAIEELKKLAAYKILCKENELEIDAATLANLNTYVEAYWAYGYSTYFEPNGVGLETYKAYIQDTYYADLYFDFIYGEGGEKEISAEDLKAEMLKNYVIADTLSVAYDDFDGEEDDLKAQLKAYVEDINNGKKTFEEVYKVFNPDEETEETSDTEETDEDAPIDPYAQIAGAEGTDYESEYYETISKLDMGKATLVEEDDYAYIFVKQDISTDEYYLEYLDTSLRHALKDDEMSETIEEYCGTLEAEINKYAVNQFKVKKIAY